MVCHKCSKLLVDESDPRFAKVKRIKDPKRRFNEMWNLCKTKMICETDEELDEDRTFGESDTANGVKRVKHGGCGSRQPIVRRNGLGLTVQYKSQKDDVKNFYFFFFKSEVCWSCLLPLLIFS